MEVESGSSIGLKIGVGVLVGATTATSVGSWSGALVAVWITLIAGLMISNMATLSWTLIRPRHEVRLGAIALAGLVFAALLTEPWWTLAAISIVYLALMPYAVVRYGRIKRQRGGGGATPATGGSTPRP